MIPQIHNPLKKENEWHWTVNGDTETYILATCPTSKRFTLVQIKQSFETEYLVSQLDTLRPELDGIESGLYNWVRTAVNIHEHAADLKNELKHHKELTIDGRTFLVEYDNSGEILVNVPGVIVIANRSRLTDKLPEINYISNGRLMSHLVNYIMSYWNEQPEVQNETLSTPAIFYNTEKFAIDGYEYELAYQEHDDIVYLRIPSRVVQTHTLLDRACPEITEMLEGRLATEIRKYISELIETV